MVVLMHFCAKTLQHASGRVCNLRRSDRCQQQTRTREGPPARRTHAGKNLGGQVGHLVRSSDPYESLQVCQFDTVFTARATRSEVVGKLLHLPRGDFPVELCGDQFMRFRTIHSVVVAELGFQFPR